MASIPQNLIDALRPINIIVGHYGSGKTNLCMNLAHDLARLGHAVTVIDLDIVNPYFRASEQRKFLEEQGVNLVAPVFSEAGTSLDVPSITGQVMPALQDANDNAYVLVDAGGDDAGATALGRFARIIADKSYAMFYVANRFRNLVQDPRDALVNLQEIEQASHLKATSIINNSHLKDATTPDVIEKGIAYSKDLADLTSLPLVCSTIPPNIDSSGDNTLYPVQCFVKNPWE